MRQNRSADLVGPELDFCRQDFIQVMPDEASIYAFSYSSDTGRPILVLQLRRIAEANRFGGFQISNSLQPKVSVVLKFEQDSCRAQSARLLHGFRLGLAREAGE